MSLRCKGGEHLPSDPHPGLLVNGTLQYRTYHVGFVVCGYFSLFASCLAGWLMYRHLRHYTKPKEQRHILRMLLMVPIYAWVSFLSYFWWKHALYFQLIRDCYEAVVVTSFYYLVLQYLAPTAETQKAAFEDFELNKWIWPCGCIKYRPSSGYQFLMITKIMVIQYAIVRPLTTIASCVFQATGYYCLSSWSPLYWHMWSVLIITISIGLAMYFILQLLVCMKEGLVAHDTTLQFLSVKGAVFIIFWQATLLSLLEWFGVIKATEYWSAGEVAVGVDALCISFEMILFGMLHMKAFSVAPYITRDKTEQVIKTRFWKSLWHAFNFRDWARETKDSSLHIVLTVKDQHRPIEIERRTDLFEALGTSRPRYQGASTEDRNDAPVVVKKETDEVQHLSPSAEEEASALLAIQEAEERASAFPPDGRLLTSFKLQGHRHQSQFVVAPQQCPYPAGGSTSTTTSRSSPPRADVSASKHQTGPRHPDPRSFTDQRRGQSDAAPAKGIPHFIFEEA